MTSTTSMLLRSGFDVVRRDPLTLLLAAGIVLVADLWTLLIPPYDEELQALGLLWSWGVGWVLFGGFSWLSLRAWRGGDVSVPDVLHPFRTPKRWLWNVLVDFLVLAFVLAGLMALLVPGAYLALRFSFAKLLVNESGLGPVEAMKESWTITRGHEIDVLALALVSLVLLGAGLLCFVVGVVPALAVTAVAWGRMFDELREAATSPAP